MHIQYEQERLTTSYITAYDFIRQYNYVYDVQRSTPHKVFVSSIIPLEKFEVLFFQELFTVIEANNTQYNFSVFKKYSDLLSVKYEFTDADLELVVLKVYRKASSYFLDQIYDDENVWEKAEIGYFFGKTDTEMFMSYVEQNGRYENVNGLVKSIVFLKHRFEEMNVNFMVSFDVREKVPFDIDVIVSCVNEKIKEVVNSMGKEEGYLLCMEYVSELVLYDVVVDNSLVDDMKYFAGDILKK